MLPAALITAVACKTLILNELSFRNPAIPALSFVPKRMTLRHVKGMTFLNQISTSGHVGMRGTQRELSRYKKSSAGHIDLHCTGSLRV